MLSGMLALPLGGCNMPPDLIEMLVQGTSLRPAERDASVTAKVKAALLGDTNLNRFDIEVATRNGDVRLTGLVDNQRQIEHAIELARSIDGAHSIHDELGLRKSGS
jgi:hyperosmotically inducible protein